MFLNNFDMLMLKIIFFNKKILFYIFYLLILWIKYWDFDAE